MAVHRVPRSPGAGPGRFPRRVADSLRGPADIAARALLGTLLVTEQGGCRTAGRIVEVEAYAGPHDPASHAAERIGRTRRNSTMFAAPGTLYVYLSYGVHVCANVVTGSPGYPAAVLIRALEPVEGQEAMARRRGRDGDLCSGPGRLCQALGVRLEHDGTPLDEGPVWLEDGPALPAEKVGTSPRIGITRGTELPLRFFARGHPAVRSPRW